MRQFNACQPWGVPAMAFIKIIGIIAFGDTKEYDDVTSFRAAALQHRARAHGKAERNVRATAAVNIRHRKPPYRKTTPPEPQSSILKILFGDRSPGSQISLGMPRGPWGSSRFVA